MKLVNKESTMSVFQIIAAPFILIAVCVVVTFTALIVLICWLIGLKVDITYEKTIASYRWFKKIKEVPR